MSSVSYMHATHYRINISLFLDWDCKRIVYLQLFIRIFNVSSVLWWRYRNILINLCNLWYCVRFHITKIIYKYSVANQITTNPIINVMIQANSVAFISLILKIYLVTADLVFPMICENNELSNTLSISIDNSL